MARVEPTLDPNNPDNFPSLDGADGVVTEAAKFNVPVTRSMVDRAVTAGELPRFLVGGRRHFAPADVRMWLLSMRGTPGPKNDAAVSA